MSTDDKGRSGPKRGFFGLGPPLRVPAGQAAAVAPIAQNAPAAPSMTPGASAVSPAAPTVAAQAPEWSIIDSLPMTSQATRLMLSEQEKRQAWAVPGQASQAAPQRDPTPSKSEQIASGLRKMRGGAPVKTVHAWSEAATQTGPASPEHVQREPANAEARRTEAAPAGLAGTIHGGPIASSATAAAATTPVATTPAAPPVWFMPTAAELSSAERTAKPAKSAKPPSVAKRKRRVAPKKMADAAAKPAKPAKLPSVAKPKRRAAPKTMADAPVAAAKPASVEPASVEPASVGPASVGRDPQTLATIRLPAADGHTPIDNAAAEQHPGQADLGALSVQHAFQRLRAGHAPAADAAPTAPAEAVAPAPSKWPALFRKADRT